MRRTLLIALSLAVACGGRAATGSRDEVRYTGRVTLAGTDGVELTTLALPDGSAVGLAGPLLPEIQRLSGATLTVEGIPAATIPTPGVEVRRYEVIEVNGEKPWVGLLVRKADGYVLEQNGTVVARLHQPPPALTADEGARVWVTGRLVGGGVQVQSFGVIGRP